MVGLIVLEEVLRSTLEEMVAGKRPLPKLEGLTERSLRSVHGEPTASGTYHGHPCTGVVIVTARFVAIEPEEVRQPHSLCLVEDA
jgi:hypothetical protein